MKWWFFEQADITTSLPAAAAMERISTIARNRHGIIDTLNPDHQFNDQYKLYVGTIGAVDFRVKRRYAYATARGSSQSMGLVIKGQLEDTFKQRVLHLRFTVPASNLLWFLFPPLWMMVGAAYAADTAYFKGIPVVTLLAFALIFYLYWLVLAQFRRKVRGATADFQAALQGGFYTFSY